MCLSPTHFSTKIKVFTMLLMTHAARRRLLIALPLIACIPPVTSFSPSRTFTSGGCKPYIVQLNRKMSKDGNNNVIEVEKKFVLTDETNDMVESKLKELGLAQKVKEIAMVDW
jgi:hypothetical protein